MKTLNYQENGFNYSSNIETTVKVVKSQFNGLLQAQVTSTITTSWNRNGGKSVSKIFGHTSSGSFEPKKYIAFMPLNDEFQNSYKKAVADKKETEFLETIEKQIQSIINAEELRVIQFTSTKPMKTLPALGMIQRHNKTITDVAEKQGYSVNGTVIYTHKAVTSDKNPSAVFIDTFGENIKKEDFGSNNGINYQVNPEGDLCFEYNSLETKGLDLNTLAETLNLNFNN